MGSPPYAVARKIVGDRAGGVEPRPYGGVQGVQWFGASGTPPPTGGVQGVRWERADVGSELSAASGGKSEMSEWPRSKFQASAVRQRRNFGHRNRVIGPYCFCGGEGGKKFEDCGGSPLFFITFIF